MIVYCLPYAGGTSAIYYAWKKHLNKPFEIVPIELKGRGIRSNESFYNTLDEAVTDILNIMISNIKNKDEDYAIYGHSMGAIIAYELYYKIVELNLKKPLHIFFSASKAPNIKGRSINMNDLSDEEFIRKIASLGGTPREILEEKRALNMFIPRLRSDFDLLCNYKYRDKVNKIECDISIMNGKSDDITSYELDGWKELGGKGVFFYNFDGNHFFINDKIEEISEIIKEKLNK